MTFFYLLLPTPTYTYFYPTYGLLMATPRGLPAGGDPWRTRGGATLGRRAADGGSSGLVLPGSNGGTRGLTTEPTP